MVVWNGLCRPSDATSVYPKVAFWKSEFEAVEKESDASEECKILAKKAACFMALWRRRCHFESHMCPAVCQDAGAKISFNFDDTCSFILSVYSQLIALDNTTPNKYPKDLTLVLISKISATMRTRQIM